MHVYLWAEGGLSAFGSTGTQSGLSGCDPIAAIRLLVYLSYMQTIRPATQQDAAALPDIERSSGEVFRQIPHLAWIADDTVTSRERHEALIGFGAAWVSLDASNMLTGFLTAEVREDALHIWQMSVRSNQQRKGIGRNLIKAAEHWARSRHLVGLTLTTFRDVPWNAAFYRSCGFQDVDPHSYPALQATLGAEEQAGLPIEQRCAMIRLF